MEAGLFTLGGVVIGALLTFQLTRSWQREQWLLDNRRQEYRELLSSITGAYIAIAHIAETGAVGRTASPEIELIAERAAIESFRTLRDRILIAEEIEFANSLEEWDTAIQNYRRTHDEHTFAQRFFSINKVRVKMARLPVSKPNLFVRLWRKLSNGFNLWKARRRANRQ
jgi:hypothetical protein